MRSFPRVSRPWPAAIAAAIPAAIPAAVMAGAVRAGAPGNGFRLGMLAIAALAATMTALLLLEIDLPQGGGVSVGHPVVIALAALLAGPDFLVVTGVSVVVCTVVRVYHRGAWRGAIEGAILAGAGAAAFLARLGIDRVLGPAGPRGVAGVADDRFRILALAVAAGVAHLTVIALAQLSCSHSRSRRGRVTSILGVESPLLVAAAILAVAGDRGPLWGAVAVVPIVVLCVSYGSFLDARRTYVQVTQALGMIPEVAGLAPLGHGERTAAYAEALAEWLHLPADQVELATAAARLHHLGLVGRLGTIGGISRTGNDGTRPLCHGPLGGPIIGRIGGAILAEAGFLERVGEVVTSLGTKSAQELTLPEAIVRVASSFDDLVGPDPASFGDACGGLVARHAVGVERSVALALAQLCDAQPGVVLGAAAAGRALTLRPPTDATRPTAPKLVV